MLLIILLLAGCSGSNPPAGTSTPEPSEAAISTPGAEEPADDFEEGTSPTDDIVNTTAADKVILVVSFGTSFNESRRLTIGGIETAIAAAYPDYQVRRAFTSQIIIDKLAERDGLIIDNVEEAMNRLALDKVKEVIIQPTHVMTGFEYDDVIAEIEPFADKFESLKIGKPLLVDNSDYDAVAELIVAETAGFRADGTVIVYMGHGTEHEAGSTYIRLQETLITKGYDDYIIGTVEHGVEIDEVLRILGEMDAIRKVVLRPLMVVAGDHANNDMAGGEEDSWDFLIEQEGYEVETVLEGLGQIKGIQDLYIKHVEEATDMTAAPAASAAGVSAKRIRNGTYSITVDSDSSIFKIVECELTVEDEGMTALITLTGTGFSHVCMGTGEEAGSGEVNWVEAILNGERNSFTVPVEALDKALECSGRSARREDWYDHKIVFESSALPADAFSTVEIDAELVGGTGRASIESAELTGNIARIVWSSANYTYMIIDGTEYLPVNEDGNSTFEIPVVLDEDMAVTACTVAMSEPREIEYTLFFDSATIR